MDTHLNSLIDEMCQVNTRVGRIAWRQACLGGFAPSSSPSLEASMDEDDDGGDDTDASFSNDDEITTFWWLPFIICDKKWE